MFLKNLRKSQVLPVNPGGHLQLNPPIPSDSHTPWFKHWIIQRSYLILIIFLKFTGLGWQASQIWHKSPWKPNLQKHLIVNPSELQDPPFPHGFGAHKSPTKL